MTLEEKREKNRKYQRRWRKADPEQICEANGRRREVSPEKVSEANRRWREANPERKRASDRRWQKANPERHRVSRRRNWLKTYYGITMAEYEAILADQGGVCAICKGPQAGK